MKDISREFYGSVSRPLRTCSLEVAWPLSSSLLLTHTLADKLANGMYSRMIKDERRRDIERKRVFDAPAHLEGS